MKKQVDKSHYEFTTYMTKARWSSVWHQIDEILRLRPDSVLEIGPGPGVFKQISSIFGLKIESLDLDSELEPDHVGSATELPFPTDAYDVVCAFQMLEHLPYSQAMLAFREMTRVSNRHVVISVPDARTVWRYHIHLPKLGDHEVLIPRPRIRPKKHVFEGEHYWELNKRGYELAQFIKDCEAHGTLLNTYRVPDNPYHRFFVFEAAKR